MRQSTGPLSHWVDLSFCHRHFCDRSIPTPAPPSLAIPQLRSSAPRRYKHRLAHCEVERKQETGRCRCNQDPTRYPEKLIDRMEVRSDLISSSLEESAGLGLPRAPIDIRFCTS